MGLADRVKRKFSLSTLQSKSDMAIEEMKFDYDTDSPPYSPTASEMERPSFHPQKLYDLRTACAVLVNQTCPPDLDDDEDNDDQPAHLETLRKVEAARKAKVVAAQARAVDAKSQKGEVRESKHKVPTEEARKEQPKRYSSTRPTNEVGKNMSIRDSKQPSTHAHSKQVHIPTGTFLQGGQRRASGTIKAPPADPLVEASKSQFSPRPRETPRQNDEDAALNEIRRSIHVRPKTSAAACVDYSGPTAEEDSSNSTSRTTSNYETKHRPTSTGLTSLAQTPGEEKRRSQFRRPSDESYQEALAIEQAAIWRREQELQAQAEQYAKSGRAARPASRTSKLSRMTSRSESVDRPSSRAGSLASSIASGINNYIRPRASMDSMRSGQSSSTELSRSQSQGSTMSRHSSGFWRRNSLRSFRSGRQDREERKSRKKGEPNLNRPLPALPGLDQYKETKTHVGQMMKSSTKSKKKVNKKSISEPKPVIASNTEFTATLPKPATPILDRALRQEEEERSYMSQQAPEHFDQHDQYHYGHQHHDHHRHHQHHHDHPRRSTVPKNMESSQRSHRKGQKHNSQASKLPRRSTDPAFHYSEHGEGELHYPKPSESRNDLLSKTQSQPATSQTLSPAPTSASLYKAPPIIRGPSYKKELEAGVYPRPMDVNKGMGGLLPASKYSDGRAAEASNTRGHRSRAGDLDVDEGGFYQDDSDDQREIDRRNGLKSRMGRMFGSGSSGGVGCVGGGGTRRAVAAN